MVTRTRSSVELTQSCSDEEDFIPRRDHEAVQVEDLQITPRGEGDDRRGEGDDRRASSWVLASASIVAGGIQFGWALQLSLLTPYVQELGISHSWASLIWLCGPISGLVVQPLIGAWSDKCRHPLGRRRPFILVGAALVSMAVMVIGFSADLGYMLGDSPSDKGIKRGACAVFIVGFWLLDLANNAVQGPVRALVADIASADQRETGNALFSLWMAVGNILGYGAGAIGVWYKWFPFLSTRACGTACANLKAAFLLAVVFLASCTAVCMYFAKEERFQPQPSEAEDGEEPASRQESPRSRDGRSGSPRRRANVERAPLLEEGAEGSREASMTGDKQEQQERWARRSKPLQRVAVFFAERWAALPAGMAPLMGVLALTWLAWFPFLLFDTDWMGREVFRGSLEGGPAAAMLYQKGVRFGAVGLLLNSVVLGLTSLAIHKLSAAAGGPHRLWGAGMVVLSGGMLSTAAIAGLARMGGASTAADVLAVLVFALLGVPLAITFSVPFAMASHLAAESGGGQGLTMGILNLAIVVPQVIVSLGAGPWDSLFGGGNQPAFFAATAFAAAAACTAFWKLPKLHMDKDARFEVVHV